MKGRPKIRTNMKNFKVKVGVVATNLFLSALLAPVALAAPLPKPITSLQQIIDKITLASEWLFGFIVVIAVVFLLYAAFLYLTAGGNEEKLKQAKNIIIYVVVAIVVALVAAGVVNIVQNFIGAPITP